MRLSTTKPYTVNLSMHHTLFLVAESFLLTHLRLKLGEKRRGAVDSALSDERATLS